MLGDLRRVEGVRVSGPDGRYDLMAKAVIACAGGFQANAEMRARYLEGNTDMMKVRGSRHDTGEVLRYLLELGARPAGHWQSGHMSPIDAKAPDFETPQHADGRGNTQSRYDYPYGITVNALGCALLRRRRGAALLHLRQDRPRGARPAGRASPTRSTIRPGSRCLAIRTTRRRSWRPTRSRSWRGKIGLAPDVLVHTVEEFNRAVSDDEPFLPGRLDGRATRGLAMPKSNWATRIEAPPFRAYPVTGGITFTFGGVEIDRNAQVISTMDGRSRGCSRPAISSGCSSTTTRRSPARRATPCSGGWRGGPRLSRSNPDRRLRNERCGTTGSSLSCRIIELLPGSPTAAPYRPAAVDAVATAAGSTACTTEVVEPSSSGTSATWRMQPSSVVPVQVCGNGSDQRQ